MILTPPPAILPADEAERLLTLCHYDILHSLQESVFNEFVALAARSFNLPMSLLALVDADEVEYKANYGVFGLQPQFRMETVCAQVVARGEALIFADLTQESDTPLPDQVRLSSLNKGLRFYAGVPLRMPNQFDIGTLCVLGREPRDFSAREQLVLEQLAQLVERVIVVRHACLRSSWLGREYWRLTQEYIADSLRRLGDQLGPPAEADSTAPLSAADLLAVVQHLNELGRVLREPLPGFA